MMIWLGATAVNWSAIFALAATIAVMSARRSRWRLQAMALITIAALALFFEFVTTGTRWQMLPVYTALALSGGALALSFNARVSALLQRHRYTRRLGISAVALLPGCAILFSFLFPLFVLPAPTGPFSVGATRVALTDRTREEAHSDNPGAPRKLMVGIWYPAVPTPAARPQSLFPAAGTLAAMINRENWPFGWVTSHLDRIATHSVTDAPLAAASARFPVVLFSHGLGALGVQNITLFETLASRGYVVVSIEHSFGNLATVFPDGNAAPFLPSAYETHDPEIKPAEEAALERAVFGEDAAQIVSGSRAIMALTPDETRSSRFWFDYWSADQRFVAAQIAAQDGAVLGSRFRNRLDPERIGFAGMSFGGSAAQVSCTRDPLCRVGINLDGYRAVMVEAPPQNAPFLYFNNSRLSVLRPFLDRDLGPSYWIKIARAEHFDFTDLPLITPALRWVGLSGTADSHRMTAIINAYVLAFLDTHLKGRPAPLLARTPPPWTDVRFTMNDYAKASMASGKQGTAR